jgi:hypothetical protein
MVLVDLLSDAERAVLDAWGLDPIRVASRHPRRVTIEAGDVSGRRVFVKLWPATTPEPSYPWLVHTALLSEIARSTDRVVIPEPIDAQIDDAWEAVSMSRMEGLDYRERWHYERAGSAGGAALDPEAVDVALIALQALVEIPLGPLVDRGLRVRSPIWLVDSARRSLTALAAGGEGLDELQPRLFELLAKASFERPLHLSNVDFRFPNLWRTTDGRPGVVDWDDAQASRFEIEHAVSHLWLMLWAAPSLRDHLLGSARRRFSLATPELRAMLGWRAVTQAALCAPGSAARRRHLDQARVAIDEAAFDREVWQPATGL